MYLFYLYMYVQIWYIIYTQQWYYIYLHGCRVSFKIQKSRPRFSWAPKEKSMDIMAVQSWETEKNRTLGFPSMYILLMEEILHHLGCKKPVNYMTTYQPVQGVFPSSVWSSAGKKRVSTLNLDFCGTGPRYLIVKRPNQGPNWGSMFIPYINPKQPGAFFSSSKTRRSYCNCCGKETRSWQNFEKSDNTRPGRV